MTRRSSYRWSALAEVLFVAGLIEVYIWWLRAYCRWCGVLLLVPMVLSHVLHGETPQHLGFGWKDFRRAWLPVAGATAGAAAAVVALGHLFGIARPLGVRHALADLAAYCLWGLAQQYILNGFFVNRLCTFYRDRESLPVKNAVAMEAAGLFAIAHIPNAFLMGATALGGYFAARVYLRYRSLYALGLAHGAVGFCLISLVPDSISHGLIVGPRYSAR